LAHRVIFGREKKHSLEYIIGWLCFVTEKQMKIDCGFDIKFEGCHHPSQPLWMWGVVARWVGRRRKERYQSKSVSVAYRSSQ